MLSSSLDAMLKLSKTTSPPKLFDYDCVTLYPIMFVSFPRCEQRTGLKSYAYYRKKVEKINYFSNENFKYRSLSINSNC